jgi:hypothetical protein
MIPAKSLEFRPGGRGEAGELRPTSRLAAADPF